MHGKIWRKLWNIQFWQSLTCLLSKFTYFCSRYRFLDIILGFSQNLTRYDRMLTRMLKYWILVQFERLYSYLLPNKFTDLTTFQQYFGRKGDLSHHNSYQVRLSWSLGTVQFLSYFTEQFTETIKGCNPGDESLFSTDF